MILLLVCILLNLLNPYALCPESGLNRFELKALKGSETLQITSCYGCFIRLVHVAVLCLSCQFDENVDEQVCKSSLRYLYIARIVMHIVEFILVVFEAESKYRSRQELLRNVLFKLQTLHYVH